MKKDFRQWHLRKVVVNESLRKALFHEREAWWCTLGENVGFEQDGSSELFTRPVVIIKKYNLDSCLIVSLTSRHKEGRYYFPIGKIEEKEATAILSQIRFVDQKRLNVKICTIDRDIFNELTRALIRINFGIS